MAIYRLEAKIVSRRAKDRKGKAIPGRQVSVVAKAAYRSGEKLKDDRIGRTFNYRSRSQEVVHAEIVAPGHAPHWLRGRHVHGKHRHLRERLWNTIERVEKRSDSQLAREFIIALPVELSIEEQIGLIRGWCLKELVAKGFIADFAIHRSKDGRNPHAHILSTLRPVVAEEGEEGTEGFGKKPDTTGLFNRRGSVGKGAKSDLEEWRESWGHDANAALLIAGYEVRIDHRSLAEQGIDRVPEPKIGVNAIAMQRRGAVRDPDKVRAARQVRLENQLLPAIRALQRTGEVRQRGAGNTWWERARRALWRVQEQASHVLKDTSTRWRDYIESLRKRLPERRWAASRPEKHRGHQHLVKKPNDDHQH